MINAESGWQFTMARFMLAVDGIITAVDSSIPAKQFYASISGVNGFFKICENLRKPFFILPLI
jgi:hypothetical protein